MYATVALIRKHKVLVERIAKTLSGKRLKHTIQVAFLAGKLALIHGQEPDKVIQAALLHDLAREKSSEELLALAKESRWPINKVEIKLPMLLHGPVAAYLAGKDFKIKDKAILDAIRYHTTGSPIMTPTAKILFVADMVEPTRKYPGVKTLRDLAYEDLDESLLACLNHTIQYLLTERGLIHPLSIEARNELLIGM